MPAVMQNETGKKAAFTIKPRDGHCMVILKYVLEVTFRKALSELEEGHPLAEMFFTAGNKPLKPAQIEKILMQYALAPEGILREHLMASLDILRMQTEMFLSGVEDSQARKDENDEQ